MLALDSVCLRGAYTPLVTPLRDGVVDHERYARLVERQVEQGSHGVVVCGTTGEPSTLTVGERNRLLSAAVEAAAGRIAVVAATGSESLAVTAQLCVEAERRGADALLVVTPYYIRPPQLGLVRYYVELAGLTRLPLLIYHIPGRTAVSVDVDTITEIAAAVPSLVGVKHAANDLAWASQVIARLGPEFRLFVGLEDLSLPMLALGGAGLMNATGNLFPRAIAQMYESVVAGDLAQARRLHYRLFELNQSVFFDTNPIPVKYMLKRLGLLDNNEHRLPMVPAGERLQRRLDEVLARALPLLDDTPAMPSPAPAAPWG